MELGSAYCRLDLQGELDESDLSIVDQAIADAGITNARTLKPGGPGSRGDILTSVVASLSSPEAVAAFIGVIGAFLLKHFTGNAKKPPFEFRIEVDGAVYQWKSNSKKSLEYFAKQVAAKVATHNKSCRK